MHKPKISTIVIIGLILICVLEAGALFELYMNAAFDASTPLVRLEEK